MHHATRGLRSAAIALIATLSLAAAATAQTARTPSFGPIRIDNFASVNAAYFRGAQPVGQDLSLIHI